MTHCITSGTTHHCIFTRLWCIYAPLAHKSLFTDYCFLIIVYPVKYLNVRFDQILFNRAGH